jgi:hypothetical protein
VSRPGITVDQHPIECEWAPWIFRGAHLLARLRYPFIELRPYADVTELVRPLLHDVLDPDADPCPF